MRDDDERQWDGKHRKWGCRIHADYPNGGRGTGLQTGGVEVTDVAIGVRIVGESAPGNTRRLIVW